MGNEPLRRLKIARHEMASKLMVRFVSLLPTGLIKRVGFLQAKSPLFHRIVVAGRRLIEGKDMVIQQGPGAGLKFQTGDSNFGYVMGTSEPDTQHAMQANIKPGDCFWDVGCNVGFLTVIGARMVGSGGKVFAFDPVPLHVQMTEQNLKANNFDNARVLQMALSSQAGTAKFGVAPIASQSTLSASGLAREGATVIEVQTQTVDRLVQQEGLTPPNVVKIDVEGAEVDVLRGMSQTLRQCRPIIILDTHGEHMACAKILADAGYFCGTGAHPDRLVEESQYFCQLLAIPSERRTSDQKNAPAGSAAFLAPQPSVQ
jgi:FkbM family methyltransferase